MTARPRIARWALAACVALAVAVPAHGDLDVNGASQAVAALGQLQQNLQAMQGAMGGSLGPYHLETQCTWCSEREWWGFGLCTRETTRRQWTDIDFNWTRQRIAALTGQASAQVNDFAGAYAPARAWLRGVPGFNAMFQQAADTMLQVRQEIAAGTGPSDAQKARTTQALQQIVAGLQGSRQQLAAGTGALTAYLQRQSSLREQIRDAIGGADRSANDAWNSYKQNTSTWQCQDGLAERFTQIKGEFTASTQRITGAYQGVDASSRAVEQALATMTGTLVSAQGSYQSVLDQLQAAQSDLLGSFIEKLHLDVAKRQWQQLADYAAQQPN